MNPIHLFGKLLFETVLWRGDQQYGATSSFQANYFFGAGIGYWFFFLILALAATIWVYYDSQKRSLDATAFRIGTWLAVALLLPSILFKFSVREFEVSDYFEIRGKIEELQYFQDDGWKVKVDEFQTQLDNQFHPLTGFIEPIMYLGIIGGLGGVILAVAYYVTYQGQTGPVTSGPVPQAPPPGQYPAPPPPPPPGPGPQQVGQPPRPSKPAANAWLVSREGRNYQLNQGETTIGRSSSNDIQITGDTTLSKLHAKITEQNGHFKIFDLGSTNGTRVNQRRVRQPMMLAHNDEIQLGDNTNLKFVTGL